MTSRLRAALALACCAALAACAPATTDAPPTTTGPNSNREPQSPASLPRGFETPHPLTPRTGSVGTTRVGP